MKKEILFLAGLSMAGLSTFAQEGADSIRQIHHLQGVEIISTRATSKSPLAYSNLNKKDIKSQNFGQDIPFLLSLTPSVVATSDAGAGVGYTGFRVRGTDATRINISTNGIPLNDSESQSVYWVNMPDFASSLEDLQIQRGVGTSTNGAGAFGASINMKTQNLPLQRYTEINGSYSSYNTSKATVKIGTGLINNHWAFDARLSNIQSDGYIDRASTDLKSYFVQGGYYGENTSVKLITFGGKEKTYHAWDGVPAEYLENNRTYNPCGYMGDDANGNPLYYQNQTDNYTQTHYQLILTHAFNPYLTLNTALHYTHGDGYYEEYKQDRTLTEYSLSSYDYQNQTIEKSDLVRRKSLDNDFGGGVFSLNYNKNKWDISFGAAANKYDGDHTGTVIWVKNIIGNNTPDRPYYASTGSKLDLNTYLKANYTIIGGLSAYADVQYRYIDYKINGQNDVWNWIDGEMQLLDIHKKFNFFNPKAGLFYQINKENDVYASVAAGHREPTRNNYTDAAINEKPTAERMTDFEAGYSFKNSSFTAGVNLYYMKYKDQLVQTGKVNEIGEMLTSNIPDSYRAGIEVMAGAHITSWLNWTGNATFSKNKIKNYTEFVDLYNSDGDWINQVSDKIGTTTISFSPSVIANSFFTADYKNWSLGFQSNYVGKQYIDNTASNSRSLDAYFVNNLRLGYKFALKGIKEIGVNFLINNIFNEKYESNAWVSSSYTQTSSNTNDRSDYFGYFPQAGTNVMLNLSLVF